MISKQNLQQQLQYTLAEIELPSSFGNKISGKVRESYIIGDKRIIIASDRLSAFDRILTTIPFKGALLNQMAAHWFEQTKHIVKNHLIEVPHPNVSVVQQGTVIPIEVVVRGYLAGSAWRDYKAGRPVSGITLPEGLKKSSRLPEPILTPSTKAEHGEHDEPISEREILERGIVKQSLWQQVSKVALELFAFGATEAEKQGLILVDTKYEFATLPDGSLVLADEIHTQDSSRYWIAESYEERFSQDEDPVMLDKEFVREWLMSKGYMGDGEPPEFTDEFRIETAERYIKTFEMITGKTFTAEVGDPLIKIREWAEGYVG